MTDFQTQIDRSQDYLPYNGMPAFWQGFREYRKGIRSDLDGVEGQAYDRGAELAMKMERGR